MHRLIACLICSWVLLAASGIAAASEITFSDTLRRNVQFNQLSAVDGLSHDMVYDVVQDGRGYIWIATQEGLNRFDGYEVRSYEHLRTDPGTVSSDFIRSLFVDDDGILWVGTEVGVNRYDPARDAFVREPFAEAAGDDALDHSIRAMVQTGDGSYWFGTAGAGLLRIDAQRGRVDRYRAADDDSDSLPDDTILALAEDRLGNLWVGTQSGGLVRFDPVIGGFVRPTGMPEEAFGAEIRSLYEDEAGRLWIATGDAGLARYDTRRGIYERYQADGSPGALPSPRIRDVIEDDRGTIWVATGAGLAEWRESSDRFLVYSHADDDQRSLSSNRVNTLFVDDSGVLWIGTWNGLSRWNYLSDTFTYFSAADGRLPADIVTSIAEERDGALWVATYGGGLGRIDPGSGAARFYRNDPDDPTSLPDDRVMTVHVDPSDTVWVGTRSAGLARLDADAGRFDRFANDPDDPGSISGNAITSLYTDDRGALWIGTFGAGLNRLAPGADGRFARFLHDPDDAATLSGDRVITLHGDDANHLWVGTEGDGLNRLDLETGEIRRIGSFAPRSVEGAGGPAGDALDLGTVFDLHRDQYGALWIGTLGQGLLRWTREDIDADVQRVDIFDKAQGLSTDTIYGILEDQLGAIWFSSNRGLTRLDPANRSLRQFDARNGLRNSEFNQGARLRRRSGRLLFGGTTGLVSFFPGELPTNTRPPPVVVSARSRDARLATVGLGEEAPVVQVGYLDPYLAFDFVALDYVSPDKNQYRYRLADFDPGWLEADQIRRATYTNLPPGDYRFEVQAANNDGVWSNGAAVVDVQVIPAPWNSWWAYAVYGVLALGALAFFARSQRQQLEVEAQQRQELEQEVAVRTRELADRNTELEKLNHRLEEAAVTDSLTGLRNRRYADQFIASDIAQFEREQAQVTESGARRDEDDDTRSMFFMMIDLDGFKAINDQYGHYAGDLALIQVTDILRQACRSSDTIIRWGGDEFLVVGTTSSYVNVKLLAERIRDAIARRRFDVGHDHIGRMSASIGMAPYPLVSHRYGFCNWEVVAALADQGAYISKASGRNAWVSITGNESLTEPMLSTFADQLAECVREGYLSIDASFDHPPVLTGRDEGRGQPAGPG